MAVDGQEGTVFIQARSWLKIGQNRKGLTQTVMSKTVLNNSQNTLSSQWRVSLMTVVYDYCL